MTNNQLCGFLEVAGCFILFMSMGLMFFGLSSAMYGVAVGAVIGLLGLVNYD